MTFFDIFLWVVFPYIMLTIFVVGHIHRYNSDQLGWSAQSTEILEKRILKWGSPLFHYGIIFAFFGHVGGILIPKWFFDNLGIDEHLYHLGAVWLGGLAGIAALIGISILLYRRLRIKRIWVNSGKMDIFVLILLFLLIIEGVYITLVSEPFPYRETIGPWFRSVLMFKPNPLYMLDVPFFLKLHVHMGFFFFGLLPYTKVVHLWSLPLEYLRRNYIIYRSRNFLKSLKLMGK